MFSLIIIMIKRGYLPSVNCFFGSQKEFLRAVYIFHKKHALCTLIRVRSLYRDDTLQTVFP